MPAEFTKIARADVREQFLYPPVGRTERQWDLFVRELFKRHTGNSPYQYHLARRLNRAQTLLAESDLTIKEVAAALQFNDAYHFSKTFKARTGRCPSRWR
jgi:transcriptional regulator GlxA family with amidase domain